MLLIMSSSIPTTTAPAGAAVATATITTTTTTTATAVFLVSRTNNFELVYDKFNMVGIWSFVKG